MDFRRRLEVFESSRDCTRGCGGLCVEWDFGKLVRGRRGCCGLLPGWRDGRNCCERRGQCGGGDARSGGDSLFIGPCQTSSVCFLNLLSFGKMLSGRLLVIREPLDFSIFCLQPALRHTGVNFNFGARGDTLFCFGGRLCLGSRGSRCVE